MTTTEASGPSPAAPAPSQPGTGRTPDEVRAAKAAWERTPRAKFTRMLRNKERNLLRKAWRVRRRAARLPVT